MATVQSALDRRLRAAGMGNGQPPSLERVERRRLQLWILTAIVVLAAAIASVIGAPEPDADRFWWAQPRVMRVALLLLSIAFCAYAIEKELHLRQLTRELIHERSFSEALTGRVQELTSLIDASKAMNSVLDLDEVLRIILTSAIELLRGAEGSVMLVQDDGWLRSVCVVGNERARGARVRIGEGIAGRVAASGESVLLSGAVDPDEFPGHTGKERPPSSAMSVPLRHRGELLGVLNCNADRNRSFSDLDLRAFTLFAEQAASAIANARLYEAQRSHVQALIELDEMKNEFISAVSHDLRTPLTSIVGSTAVAMRDDLPQAARKELLESVRRQADRLEAMVQQLLDTAAHQHAEAVVGPIDLTERVNLVAAGFAARGIPIKVDAPAGMVVRSSETVDRVLSNLIDNAYKHGAEPIEVSLEDAGDEVVCSVTDAGSGIPPEHRARVFERFVRSDPSRTIGGLGLGLAIVRSIVEGHSGSVWIEDAPRGGTSVRFRLPRA